MTAVVGDEFPRSYDPVSWTDVPERIQQWAAAVSLDIRTPDLWAALQDEREILTGGRFEHVENTPFTPDEQSEIAEGLQRLKRHVEASSSLTQQQVQRFGEQLDYLREAARRSGRRDWFLMFAGVVLGMTVQSLVPPDAVQDFVSMAVAAIGDVWSAVADVPPRLSS